MKQYLIIGGTGYVGMSLATAIARNGVHVKVFDVFEPNCKLPVNVSFIQVCVCMQLVQVKN